MLKTNLDASFYEMQNKNIEMDKSSKHRSPTAEHYEPTPREGKVHTLGGGRWVLPKYVQRCAVIFKLVTA